MTINTARYAGAKSCTGGPQPGAYGALDWYLSNYKSKGGVSDGIYNCRSVRGGSTTSLHGEGRAIDMGVRPYRAGYGTDLAKKIVAMSKELGVQCVIWNRHIWSTSYPHSGFRSYSGVDPHTGHLHVELTWHMAKKSRSYVAKKWKKVLGGKIDTSKISGGGSSTTYKTVKGKTPTLKLYVKGEPVKTVQRKLGINADGYYGPSTKNAVKRFQKSKGLTADGIVGPKTWAALNKKKAPKKPGKSTTGKAPAFPLPKGWYFGPKSGPKRSVSGFHGHKADLKRWQTQMKKRGWGGIGKPDGLYGAKTAKVVRQFQREKHLGVDGLVGAKTWKAAWTANIT